MKAKYNQLEQNYRRYEEERERLNDYQKGWNGIKYQANASNATNSTTTI